MNSPTPHPARQEDLRQRAIARLTSAHDPVDARSSPVEALGALFELASSPDTAPDALALLHELQVHQVEIDLQNEELRASRGELEAALRRQAELYDLAPAGYLTLDAGLVMHELNGAAARLLGAERTGLVGQSMATVLTPKSAAALGDLLAKAGASGSARYGELSLETTAGTVRRVHARAVADSASGRFLVVLVGPDMP